ncbi:hypothetical protein ACFQ4C_10430 [Larkinella insperata]|uniref:ZU5 domain-containing protein n=1 Tax=Larkinella insperata TaxID=332158 RepID=A0ABW3Q3I2_9BACT|nr:hypothetical protein [Larkinella insperata]
MNVKHFLLAGWAFLAALTSCKHEPSKIEPVEKPPAEESKPFPIGKPTGVLKTFAVGPAGGELNDLDNGLKLTVPAGALKTETVISVQTVESTCPARVGKSVRLLPHDVEFAKPVTIEFSYAAFKDSLASTKALSLAYQDEKGVWSLMMNRAVNQKTQTVRVATTHFSDWSLATAVRLLPFSVTLSEKQEQKFQLIQYVKINSYEEFATTLETDEELAPLVQPEVKVIYEGQPLNPAYAKEGAWQLHSVDPDAEEGEIHPQTNQSYALYKAPAFIPQPQNVGVSVGFNVRKGKVIFVANVMLMPKNSLVYRIGNGPWKTIHDTFVVRQKGEYALGGFDAVSDISVAIIWTGEVGTYRWSMVDQPKNATTFGLNDMKGNNHYEARYWKEKEGFLNSGGSLTITKVGKVTETVSGKFTVSPTGLGKIGVPNGMIGPAIEGYFTVTRMPDVQ